jgi:hypothetical protein
VKFFYHFLNEISSLFLLYRNCQFNFYYNPVNSLRNFPYLQCPTQK